MQSITPIIDKLERQLANKHQKYWAHRRTELELLRRSKKYGEATINQLIDELSVILESGKLIYPTLLNSVGLHESDSLKEKKLILGLRDYEPNYTREQLKFMEFQKNAAENGRQSSWKWRIANHSEEYQAKGWYPFFVTLTIDPNNYDGEQVWKEGRALRKYIRKLSNVVTNELGVQPAHKTNTPESEYITYVGVIEHGKSKNHHHAHLLIWMREIPYKWKQCPNRNIQNKQARTRRENKAMRKYWKYSLPGLSPALYFHSIGDVWSKLNFAIPLSKGAPLRIGTARQSGGYLVKYMSKDYKLWKHRTKATRNLGKKGITHKLSTMSDLQIEALTWRPSTSKLNHSLKTIHSVPLALLRQCAKQENYLRKFRLRQLDLKTLTKENFGSFQKMLQSVQRGARPDRMDSQDYYDWVGEHLPDIIGYSDELLTHAHKQLHNAYPPCIVRSKHVSIPANRT